MKSHFITTQKLKSPFLLEYFKEHLSLLKRSVNFITQRI
jgi:hypothetical protein